MNEALDHRKLYRLPWNLADNPIAWLEPTQACNLACDGCYRQNEKAHKSLETVQSELETFARLRTFDGVSIAGGDPLLHPDIVEIVRRSRRMGYKAILNTNGLALTRELLLELKAAGLTGLTFHVDSKQGRPGWRGKTEVQMNDLRQSYADLVADVGGLACAFNSTVYEDTLNQVPDIVAWGARNIERVHTLVFITYRAARLDAFDYFAAGKPLDMGKVVYTLDAPRRTDISSREVVATIRTRFPDFQPCGYLNGTEQPDSFKWLASVRVGDRKSIHAYLGPKVLELSQAFHHLARGRYMSYAAPALMRMGRSALLGGALVEPSLRAAAKRYLVRSPAALLQPLHLQSVVVIQPIDVLPDGRQNMCDGCPDMTVHEGRLAWSCRLEELRQFGCFAQCSPKACSAQGAAEPHTKPS